MPAARSTSSRGLVWAIAGYLLVDPAVRESDAFAGRWKVDPARSAFVARCCAPEEDLIASQLARQELLTIDVAGDVESAVEDTTGEDGMHTQRSYRAKYNDGRWAPFRRAAGPSAGETIMIVRVDARTVLCIQRGSDRLFSGLTLRRLSKDGNHMQAISINPLGKLRRSAALDRQ
jgi:hypothetical protein